MCSAHKKFSPVSIEIKQIAMNEYLTTNKTTKEIGEKYGFNHRRLREWFLRGNRLFEFEKKARENNHKYIIEPKSVAMHLKITGNKNLTYRGQKLEMHQLLPNDQLSLLTKYVANQALELEKIKKQTKKAKEGGK